MLKTANTKHLWLCPFILVLLVTATAIISLLPCPSRSEEEIFTKIEREPRYKMVIIRFQVEAGALDDDAEIEILRADTMKGTYQVIGSLEYEAGQKSYLYEDKKIKKASYYYQLRVKGKEITSRIFRGTASLVPPGT